jgi:hypothetical protein
MMNDDFEKIWKNDRDVINLRTVGQLIISPCCTAFASLCSINTQYLDPSYTHVRVRVYLDPGADPVTFGVSIITLFAS